MENPTYPVWTFTGLYNVDLGSEARIDLTEGFFLSKPTPLLLSARSRHDLSGSQFRETEAISCFLVQDEQLPILRGRERDQKIQLYQDGLMAIQILKPVRTLGVIFQGSNVGSSELNLETTYHRAPMEPGEWALTHTFGSSLISQLPDLIPKVQKVMRGSEAEPKNAIYLLQMALEHDNPLIAGLLGVMGLEAMFDSENRQDFRNKLCAFLGNSVPAFPNWISPAKFSVPPYTVDQIAIDLYTLRSKISHGVDLKKAAGSPKYPVDLLKSVTLIDELPLRRYSLLLSEAAIYLLGQVLQKAI